MATKPAFRLVFDDKDLLKRLKKTEASVKSEAATKGLRAAENYLIAGIKAYYVENSDLNVVSGNLLNSITEDRIVIGTKSYVLFGPHSVYGAIHEFGGVIRPTRGPYLVFMGRDGKLVFTKLVVIPARPYMRPFIDSNGDEAMELMGVTIGKILDNSWS